MHQIGAFAWLDDLLALNCCLKGLKVMRKINTFRLYQLGKFIHPLTDLNCEERKYGEVFMPLLDARIRVSGLFRNADLALKTCKQAADNLIASINEVVPVDIDEAFNKNRTDDVFWWALRQIKDGAQKFETVLAEELAILDTYAIAQKGAYSTSDLIVNAEVMFPVGIRGKIPNRALADINEAGRCLAFETPTAAAFHILRALESVIVAYYGKIVGSNPADKRRNWGVYIKTLRSNPASDPKILDFLDHIKNSYRNPISHPDATLDTEEVVVLLGVVVGAITQISIAL